MLVGRGAGMKKALIGIAALAIAVAGCRGAQTPEQVVEDMYRAAETGNCDGFGDRFTQQFREMAGAKLEQACREGAKEGKAQEKRLKTLHILEKQEDEAGATLRVQPELNDGTRQEEARIRLVKEDGRWKIEPLK
jgi:hypothetical protein